MSESKSASVKVPLSAAAGGHDLWLIGELTGEAGSVVGAGTLAVTHVEIRTGDRTYIRAILSDAVELPAGLITAADPAAVRARDEIEAELAPLAKEAAAKFRARAAEGFRRLRTVEVDWAASSTGKVAVTGAFLDGTAGSVKLRGHARLALGGLFQVGAGTQGGDPSTADLDMALQGAALAEFRATAAVTADIGGARLARNVGIVVSFNVGAAARLSLVLDDLNLSLPPVALPSLDLSQLQELTLPGGKLAGRLVGAFSEFSSNAEVDYTWSPADPVLTIGRARDGFAFAVLDPAYGKWTDPATLPPIAHLAALDATVTSGDVKFTLEGGRVAVAGNGAVLQGRIAAGAAGETTIPDGIQTAGPLRFSWRGVVVAAETGSIPIVGGGSEPPLATIRAKVQFDRLSVELIDDPATRLVLRGVVELTPTGTRVHELHLVEPDPLTLVAERTGALLRGAGEVIHLITRLQPKREDLTALRRVVDVVGRMAVEVARAGAFVAGELANGMREALSLVAGAAAGVAEMVVGVLGKLSELLAAFDGDDVTELELDVEVRVSLRPVRLRQVILTFGKIPDAKRRKLSALGFELEVRDGWRPGIVLDLDAAPGAYLVASRATGGASPEIARLATDLWLRHSADDPVVPVRDVGRQGERPAERVLTLTVSAEPSAKRLLVILAGVRRGKPVFLQCASLVEATSAWPHPAELPVTEGRFSVTPLGENVTLEVQFEPDRALPLLGMGQPTAGEGDFLDRLKNGLGQVVTVRESSFRYDPSAGTVVGTLGLDVQAAGLKTSTTLGIDLSLETLDITLQGPSGVDLQSSRIEQHALGLTWIVEQKDAAKRLENVPVPMFRLAFAGGEGGFALRRDDARMEVRFDALAADGDGLAFEVEQFRVGRGGLDLVATTIDRPVRLAGLDVPFLFKGGRLEITGSKLTGATVSGRGKLPKGLVGDADCTVTLVFAEGEGGLVLQSGKVELDKLGEPIVCETTRFTLTITDLDIGFVRENGYHFYFLVTGSVRFTPNEGEFADGLLKHLGEIEIPLERTPLTADPRVLVRHLAFQKALNPRKTVTLFNVFTFELRGFGFHPSSPKFAGRPPAVNLSGQIRFSEFGDVMQPKMDFHGLWIAPPDPGKRGLSLPRIKADGLGVDLQLSGAVRVRGSVLAVDPGTESVEGRDLAPPGYETSGFLGEGALEIPGWGSMEASLGLLEVASKDRPDVSRRAFFLYLQKNKLAVEIPTPIWTFYLREAGFGFGYRYTLEGIKAAEEATSTAQLVDALDEVSKRQGDLARFSAWRPEGEGDRFTLALRGAMQPYPAQKQWNQKAEEAAVSPFFFDVVAALRSDFTFLMSVRGWLGVNYATFLRNEGDFRSNPTFRGYLYISAPRSELLMRGLAESTGFIGEDWPEVKSGSILRRAVQSVDWSTTLYIRPGLLHYEVGWPDQLAVRLVNEPNMRVTVRGGMIFRAAEDGLVLGYNVAAEAYLRFEARVGGFIGVSLLAEVKASFLARVIAFLAWRFKDSLLYGLVSLDVRVSFTVEAWMKVNLGFKKITLRIRFSFSVQLTAAVELAISPGGVGGRVAARVIVKAFGRGLSVGVGFRFNDAALDRARARVQRFLALSITAEEPDTPAVAASKAADQITDKAAATASAMANAPKQPAPDEQKPGLPADVLKAQHGRSIRESDFWLVLRKAGAQPDGQPVPLGDDFAYALLVPKESPRADRGSFYAAPVRAAAGGWDHRVNLAGSMTGVSVLEPRSDGSFIRTPFQTGELVTTMRLTAPIEVPEGEGPAFTLREFFNECFLADTTWKLDGSVPVPTTGNWKEPLSPRGYAVAERLQGTREERDRARQQAQREHAAAAIRAPYDEDAYQARSTLMTMFGDQFVTLAETGRRPSAAGGAALTVFVTDLGLVFFGPAKELEKLDRATVEKGDDSAGQHGAVELLNPRSTWFDVADPVLADERTAVEPDAIKLDWRLELRGVDDADARLGYYEVVRTIEGSEFTPHVMRVCPAATAGERDARGVVALKAPDWQLSDTLDEDTGVSAAARRALLPQPNDPDGLLSAAAWLDAFGGRGEVTVTYLVTPIDMAGVRGLPRAFVVDVQRPAPPVRPATGEVRIVQRIDRTATGGQALAGRPGNVEVWLAVTDPGWARGGSGTAEGAQHTIERVYRLVVDPEDLEPSGHYGADADTARVRGPGPWVPSRTRDEQRFEVHWGSLINVKPMPGEQHPGNPAVEELEPDKETRERFRWVRLDPLVGDALQAALWSRPGGKGRVAVRFRMETVVRYTRVGPVLPPVEFVSRRVVMPVEHVLIGPTGVRTPLRPDAFEWAETLDFPPLGVGRVQADSGWANFHMPARDKRLRDLVYGTDGGATSVLRDPERRVITRVRMAALPGPHGVHPLHETSVAAFDLHELALDDVAPGDVPDPENGAAREIELTSDANAWKRANPVARVEQLAPGDAALSPAGNQDWQGWDAFYPSESFRLGHGGAATAGSGGDALPTRAAWYSDRESTPYFAERRPRLRLLHLPAEAVVAELLADGRPHTISAALQPVAGSPAAELFKASDGARLLPPLALHDVVVGGLRLREGLELSVPSNGAAVCTRAPNGAPFDAASVRALLLCLGWAAFEDAEGVHPLVLAWRQNPCLFDGLQLVLEGKTDTGFLTGRSEVALDLRSPHHPLLEEVLGDLALDIRTATGPVYSRYVVMPQPVTAVGARNLAGFLGGTAVEADPYGWRVLQALGSAVTVRLFDNDEQAFVRPDELARRIHAAFSSALGRWNVAYDEAVERITGQPFVELYLRPGSHIVPAGFDSAADAPMADAPTLRLADSGLAFAQISLRPRPARVWRYARLEFDWNDPALLKSLLANVSGASFRVKRKDRDVAVVTARGGVPVELNAETPEARVRLGVPELARRAEVQDPLPGQAHDLTLFVRVPGTVDGPGETAGAAGAFGLELVLEYGPGSSAKPEAPGPPKVLEVRSDTAPLALRRVVYVDEPATTSPDPYGVFEPRRDEEWAAAFVSSTAQPAISTFIDGLRATAEEGFELPTPEKLLESVGTYVPWAQRFLDHCAPSVATGAGWDPSPYFAVAGPRKSNPWRLAADGDGYVTVSLMHPARWAGARAYVVKPVARYHEILSRIGVPAQQAAEGLPISEAGLPPGTGVAVAVVPRTERLEPPVLVRSGLVASPGPASRPVMEFIVARHGEEALAASNRALMARLGLPTSLVTFLRIYRSPEWPGRLMKLPGDALPDPLTLPPRPGTLARRPGPDTDLQVLDGPSIRRIASDHPGIWKGGDVWQVDPIPPHYRLIVIAAERAGIVLSDLSAVIADDLPRKPLATASGLRFLDHRPEISLVRDGGTGAVRLEMRFTMISHADLTPPSAADWLGHGGDADVCWWPDPDVVYVLSRRVRRDDGAYDSVQEDAEIHLVASGPEREKAELAGSAPPPAPDDPIVVATRGPWLEAPPGALTVRTEATDRARWFELGVALSLRDHTESLRVERVRLRSRDEMLDAQEEWGTEPEIGAFNGAAGAFAAIVTPHELTIDLRPAPGETGKTYLARLDGLRAALYAAVPKQGEAPTGWLDPEVIAPLRELAARIAARMEQGAGDFRPDEIRAQAGLPSALPLAHRPGDGPPLPQEFAFVRPLALDRAPGSFLIIRDLPTDAELDALEKIGSASLPPVVRAGGRLRAMLARRLRGETSGFWLRAVDARAGIVLGDRGVPVVTETPGIVETAVKLHPWLS